jgi:uncharacterized protein YecE (DUF72 family)
MAKWWVGCSGFYYKGWRERFYPKGLAQRKWFEYYCQFFNTVELNVTFYRFPKLEALQGWYQRSPHDFRFTVKAPRLITHYKRFNNALRETKEFYDVVNLGLQDKLGTVLFQLHPGIQYSEENLDKILNTLDLNYINALEFRHSTWWRDDVLKILEQNNITFCSISYPGLPDGVFKTAPSVYYRFHGVPQLYLSPYSEDELRNIAHSIQSFPGVKDAYAYFNNDIDVHAVWNARLLQGIVGQKVIPVSNEVLGKFDLQALHIA